MSTQDNDIDGTDDGYTLSDLTDLTGVSARTIRYYIQQGLLPAAPRSGPGARYPEDTLPRLRFIRRCQDDGLALAHIRERLETRGDRTTRETRGPNTTAPAPSTQGSAMDYLASLKARLEPPPEPDPGPQWAPTKTAWERLTIDPNLELHVRRPLSVADNRRLDRLLQAIEEIYAPSGDRNT